MVYPRRRTPPTRYGKARIGKRRFQRGRLHGRFGHLYLFHDENGNYRLDRRDDGKPAEGCCTRAIVLSAEKNEIRVRLRYEFPEEPAGEAAETPARAKIPAATSPAGTPDELNRGSE